MKFAGAPPRPPGPFRHDPLVEFVAPERGDPRPFLGRQRRRLVGRADQYSQQEVGRLAVQARDRNQPAEVDQVMDPKPLLMRVFAHLFLSASGYCPPPITTSTPAAARRAHRPAERARSSARPDRAIAAGTQTATSSPRASGTPLIRR